MRDRTVSALLSLAILLLFIAVLLRLGVAGQISGPSQAHLVSMNLPPSRQEKEKAPEASHKERVIHAASSAARPPAPLQKPEEAPPPPSAPVAPGFIHMSHDDMAAADIGRMPKVASNDGGNGQASSGTGKGPGGHILHAVDWYREPTNAELSPYFKEPPPPGAWAMIICRQAPHNQVEDCEEAGESPRGMGLARSMREAAWQFKVRPYSVDGKPQIGEWISLRLIWRR